MKVIGVRKLSINKLEQLMRQIAYTQTGHIHISLTGPICTRTGSGEGHWRQQLEHQEARAIGGGSPHSAICQPGGGAPILQER